MELEDFESELYMRCKGMTPGEDAKEERSEMRSYKYMRSKKE